MIDLINKKFGGLLVVNRQGSNKRGDPLWKCKCDCGNETIVYGASLRNGTAVSCGCKKSYSLTALCTFPSFGIN